MLAIIALCASITMFIISIIEKDLTELIAWLALSFAHVGNLIREL